MDAYKYLKAILDNQKLSDEQLEELYSKQDEVEGVLKKAFSGVAKTIKYGGSRAKNTMIRESYDLDIVCYFDCDEQGAGETLKDIFENVKDALSENYLVRPKTSALRLDEGNTEGNYTHIDVVPGRFFDTEKGDVFLYQNGLEKNRLKTNTKKHVKYIRDSGLTDTIKLVKLWREKWGLKGFKTFVLELLVIEVLKSHKNKNLDDQLLIFWKTLRDEIDELYVEDPANPTGNNLSKAFNSFKTALQSGAKTVLLTIEANGWEAVFGEIEDITTEAERIATISNISVHQSSGARPWS